MSTAGFVRVAAVASALPRFRRGRCAARLRGAWISAFGFLLVGCAPSDRDPFVRIDLEGVAEGAAVNGDVPWSLTYSLPWGFRSFTVSVDDAPAETIGRSSWLPFGAREKESWLPYGLLDTTTLAKGPHRITASMHAWGWRTWEASRSFTVDNPTHRLLRQEWIAPAINGQHATLALDYSEAGLVLRLQPISKCPIGPVSVTPTRDVRFEVQFSLPPAEEPLFCSYRAIATNRAGKALTRIVHLQTEVHAALSARAPR